jgi:Uri superfamily endonuclease
MVVYPEALYDSQRHPLDNKIKRLHSFRFPLCQMGAGGILKSTSLEKHKIPAACGTYALLLLCQRSRRVDIGKLGARSILLGWYVYVGSAFGPGGLRARCRRHLRSPQRRHWHIDYLRPVTSVQAIWFTSDPVPREHQWAGIIGDLEGASAPILHFGSSDCSCPSHLFRFSPRHHSRHLGARQCSVRRRTARSKPFQRPCLAKYFEMHYSEATKSYPAVRRRRR